MKKILKILLVCGLLISSLFAGKLSGVEHENMMVAYAAQSPKENKITVLVDNKPVTFNQEPLLIDGRVMIPVNAVAETMGWEVQTNAPTVLQFVKSVKYTDGSSEYLFSCHTSTIDLDNERIDKSIMVGVGHFFDTEDDHKIKFTTNPVIMNGTTLISVRDLAKCLYATVDWDGKNKTVNITSGTISYYDGQGLSNRDELFEQMRKYNKVSGKLTKVSEQSVKQTETTKPIITNLFQPTGVMTSTPEVGSFPARILLPGKTDVNTMKSYYEPYKYSVGHGCNWFAFGRFYETYGYRIPVAYTGGSSYLDTVEESDATTIKTERDLNKIQSGCVAVYWREKNGGHVVFVEYVERDSNDNPINVYYTECLNSDGSGTYKPKSDAKVKKATFERFKKSSSGTKDLMGYIIPQQ